MTMEWIRDRYGVPAKRGGRVEFYGVVPPVMGTIAGASNGYLRIRFDGAAKVIGRYHPTWCIRYLAPVKHARQYGPTSEVLVKSLRILMGTDEPAD